MTVPQDGYIMVYHPTVDYFAEISYVSALYLCNMPFNPFMAHLGIRGRPKKRDMAQHDFPHAISSLSGLDAAAATSSASRTRETVIGLPGRYLPPVIVLETDYSKPASQ
jgi:hypothetical protein